MDTYYRSEWTCGRFNFEKEVAICYNLIEGMVYLFEDASAIVVGEILKAGRNNCINLRKISARLNIDEPVLVPFLEDLARIGVISTKVPTKKVITQYRANLKRYRIQTAQTSVRRLQKSSVLINHDDVEMKYMERCGGIFSLMIEMTYNCSEKCIHCYNPGATRNDTEKSGRMTETPLSLSEYKRVIDEMDAQGLVKVCLTGGDPFSNPLTWDVIEYLWEKEIAIDIFTNGQKLNGQAERLASYYPRTVGISLYSNIESIHDGITRVRGSYKRTMAFIKDCSDLAMPMLLKCCIMKPNVSSYFTVKEVAYEYGMTPQFDLNITDSLDGDICASKYLRLDHGQIEIVLRDSDLPYYIDGTKDLLIEKLPIQNEQMCNAGINSICLTPSGDIQPCCAFPMKCGNIRQSSISAILDSPQLRQWKSHSITDCNECLTHPYCIFCQLCAGNNFNSTGDYLKPSENNCFLAKERYELSLAMKRGYDPLNGESLQTRLSELNCAVPQLHRVKGERINVVS